MVRRALPLLVLLLAGLATAGPARAQSVPEARAELDELKKKLNDKRDALRDLDNKERSLYATLGEFDEQRAKLQDRLAAAKTSEETLRRELVEADRSVELAEARLAKLRERLKGRVRALYVLGEGGAVRALIGAESFEDLSYRRRLVERLAESDAALVREHARLAQVVEEQRQTRAAKAAAAKRARLEIQEQAELVEVTFEERKAAVARIENEKELQVRAVKEIVERQRALGGLLHEVQKRSRYKKRRGSGVLKDGLAWPVRGTVIRRFGTIREKNTGARITSNGIEIRAPRGAPVTAAAAGSIAHVGWVRGFGRLIIVDHDEGHHTLHAHLDSTRVARGQSVARGEVIGTVGDAESINGPKLYFELRSGSRPIDPQPYLR